MSLRATLMLVLATGSGHGAFVAPPPGFVYRVCLARCTQRHDPETERPALLRCEAKCQRVLVRATHGD